MNTAKVRFTHGAVASIPGGLVYGERSFVFFVRVEKRFAAACGSQRFMRSIEQDGHHAALRRVRFRDSHSLGGNILLDPENFYQTAR